MTRDRYLKFILTVIACELLWLGVRDAAPRVFAQQEAAPVTITNVPLRVEIVESTRPLRVHVVDPVRLDAQQALTVRVGNQPLTVETGKRPLSVESVPARPGARPGF